MKTAEPFESPARPLLWSPACCAELWIFLTALVLHLVCLWQMRDNPYLHHLIVDSRRYDEWAREIARGNWMGSGVFYQAPLYPYFLALLYKVVGPSLFLVRIVQSVLGSLACVFLARAGQVFVGRPAGILAGFLLAVYAPAVFANMLIQKSVLDLLLMSAGLLVMGKAIAHGRPGTWLLGGFVLGLLMLSRETIILLVAVAVVWPVLDRRARTLRRSLALSGCVVAGAALALAPATLHNMHFGGRLTVTTFNAGTSFYLGNNPTTNGSYQPLREGRGSTDYELIDARAIAEEAERRDLTPDEISAYWFRKSFEYIAASPIEWLRLEARKLGLALNRVELIDTDDVYYYEQHSLLLRLLHSLCNFGTLLPLAVAGMVLTRSRWRELAWLYACLGVILAGLVVFYVVARYRLPAVPPLILFASAGIVGVSAALGTRERKEVLLAVAAAAVAGVVCWLPLTSKADQLATSHYNAADMLRRDGDIDGAILNYRRSMELGRTEAATLVNYATCLADAGRADEAGRVLQELLRRSPDDGRARLNLGNVYLRKGEPARALAEYEAAAHSGFRSAELGNSMGLALAATGQTTRAIELLRRTVADHPGYASAYHSLAETLAADGDTTGALGVLDAGLAKAPGHPGLLYRATWLLATAPGLSVAERRRALEYAERLAGGAADPKAVDALAAALAANGRFSEAAETAVKAEHIARERGLAGLADSVASRRADYLKGQPWIERRSE